MSAISIILILFVIYFKNMVTCADGPLYFFALGARELKLVFNSSLTNKKNLKAYIYRLMLFYLTVPLYKQTSFLT